MISRTRCRTATVLLLCLAAVAWPEPLQTKDGLVLDIGPNGRIRRLDVGDAQLAAEPCETSGFAVCDVAADRAYRAESPVQPAPDAVTQPSTFEEAKLSLRTQIRSRGEWIEFSGEVVDERKSDDRAVDVIFRLPVRAVDLLWWRDIRTPLGTTQPSRKPSPQGGQKRTVIRFAPVTARRLRITQPPSGGCPKSPNRLWLAEVEMFGRDQNRNALRGGGQVGIAADSSCTGYSTDRLVDGLRNDDWDKDWRQRGWASGDSASAKWLEFDLAADTEIARVDLYWCRERFGYATSRTVHVERWDGQAWVRIEPTEVTGEGAPGDAEKASFETAEMKLENTIYPFACVTNGARSAGLALAVCPDSPCVFQMSYLAEERCIEIVFRFGLSQLPRNPTLKGRAPFKFVLYRVDPEWGFRDAARRYYAMHPEAFRTRTDRYGLWLFVGTVSEALNPHHYAFHEGGPRGAEMDRAFNVYSCPYVLVGQREIDSKATNYEEAVADLGKLDPEKRSFYGPGRKQVIENCSLRDPKGRYILKLRRRGGSLKGAAVATFPMNPDPSLYEDRTRLTVANETLTHVKHVIDGSPYVDGIYVDSLSSWGMYRNARREHFAYIDLPLTHDDKGNVVIWNRFPHVEFLRELGKRLHPAGKIVFGNGIRNKRMWCAFECDVHGVEANRTVHKDASHYCWFRTMAHHKPFLLLYYYAYPQMECPREAAEEYIQSAVAYGIAPEVRPFGKFIKRDLDLYETFIPILRQIMRAGWEPVTHARASDADLWLERFGGGKDGLFFTVYNPTSQAKDATVTMDRTRLHLAPDVKGTELVAHGEWTGPTATLRIPPKTLRVLQVGAAPPPPPEIRMTKKELLDRALSLREQSNNGSLIDNGGFEKASPDGRPFGWGRSTRGHAEIKAVDDTAHTGRRSALLRDSDDKGAANLTLRFPFVQPDTDYELSLWVKQTPRSSAPGRLWYRWSKGTERLNAERFDFPKTTGWIHCQWTLVPPEGADSVSMTLGSSTPEKIEIYLDDVRLVRKPRKAN